MTYVDLLTEAYAEQKWIEYAYSDDDTRERTRDHFADLRLPPLERARLGVRATMFASGNVNRLFNRLPAEAFWSNITPEFHEGHRTVLRMRIGRIVDELVKVTRDEMRANELLDEGSLVSSVNHTQRRERLSALPRIHRIHRGRMGAGLTSFATHHSHYADELTQRRCSHQLR